MRIGILLSVIILIMLVVLPASVVANEWWDYYGAQSGGYADPPSTGDSNADVDFVEGTMWVWSEVQGTVGAEAYFWAWAKMGKRFVYSGVDNGTVSVKVACEVQGFMDVGSMSLAHNVMDLRIEILDVTGGIDTLVTTEAFATYPKEDQDLVENPGHLETLEFVTNSLLQGRVYAVVLAVEVWTGCDYFDSGTAEVNYHYLDGAGEVDLEMIEYWWEDTTTEYGDQSSTPDVTFCKQWMQTQYNQADELSFDLRNDIHSVARWHLDITDFPISESYYTGGDESNVFVGASSGEVLQYNTVMVSGKIWGASGGNHFEIRNQQWSPATVAAQSPLTPTQSGKILSDYFWDFAEPVMVTGPPDDWKHVFTMKNIETTGGETLKVRGLTFLVTGTEQADLCATDFVPGSLAVTPDFDLGPQEVYTEEISTGTTPMVGSFIYVKYDLMNAAGDSVLCTGWGGHHILDPSTGAEGLSGLAGFALHQNFPNPCNPMTVIPYDVPESGGHVTLRMYDVSGRLVQTLVDEPQSGGHKSVIWNGRNHIGEQVTSGVYFYRLTAPDFNMTRKMVLLR